MLLAVSTVPVHFKGLTYLMAILGQLKAGAGQSGTNVQEVFLQIGKSGGLSSHSNQRAFQPSYSVGHDASSQIRVLWVFESGDRYPGRELVMHT